MKLTTLGALLSLFIFAYAAPGEAVGPILNHCIFSWSEDSTVTDLRNFFVKISTVPGGPYTVLASIPATTGGTFVTVNLCAGQSQGQKYAVVTAVDLASNESGVSNEVPFVYDTAVPSAPANFKVQ